MVGFPYYSHIFRDSYGSGMGIVWEAYHKGVPLLGVPENPIDKCELAKKAPLLLSLNELVFQSSLKLEIAFLDCRGDSILLMIQSNITISDL